MEKEKQLLRDIGEVEEKYIDEADTQIAVHPERKISWTRFAAAAACVAAVIIVMKNLPEKDNIDIPPAQQVTTVTSVITSGVSQVTSTVSDTGTLSETTSAETAVVSGTSAVPSVTDNAQQSSAVTVTEYVAASSAEETAIIEGADPQVTMYVDTLPVTTTEKPFSFEGISNIFMHSSGSGGWADIFKLNDDGTFYGEYSDSYAAGHDENGELLFGENYCGYDGRFDNIKKISDTIYSAEVVKFEINNDRAPYQLGSLLTLIDDAVIKEGDEIIFYLAGTRTEDMDEDCVMSLGMPKAWGNIPPEVISENVIYNRTASSAYWDDNGNVEFFKH